MRTTLVLDDQLYADVRMLAAASHRSVSSVVEDALRRLLAERAAGARRVDVDLPTFSGRLRRGVSLDDGAALLDAMDRWDREQGDTRAAV
ncbi:MAG: type II toxin-antitoxin system VapB family antitoxin [Kineosporiaceae bacterium]